MILNCKVVGLSLMGDREYIRVSITEAMDVHRNFEIVNHDGLKLGQEFRLETSVRKSESFVSSRPSDKKQTGKEQP